MTVSFILAALLLLSGCDSNTVPEDKVKMVDKDGSIETEVAVSHLNETYDMLTTTHKVWKNRSMVKTFVTHDTLPSLGSGMNDATDQDGSNKQVLSPREYEIYITVK